MLPPFIIDIVIKWVTLETVAWLSVAYGDPFDLYNPSRHFIWTVSHLQVRSQMHIITEIMHVVVSVILWGNTNA